MNKRVLKVSTLFILVLGLCGMQQDEPEITKMMMTIHAETSSGTKKNTIVQYYAELHKEGKLTPTFIKRVLEQSQNSSVVLQALNEFDVPSAEKIYEELLLTSSLDSNIRLTVALFLSSITQDSENNELFETMKDESNLDIAIPLAHAFVNSKKAELQNVALLWAHDLQTREFSQHNQELERSLHSLLAKIGTPETFAEILKNLKKGGGTTAYLMEAIQYLGEASYKPAYNYCKQRAEDEDEDCPVRVEALKAMANMFPRAKAQEIIAIAEQIKASSSFYPMYTGTINDLILQLKPQ